MNKLLAAVLAVTLASGPAFGQAAALTRIGAAAAVKGSVKAQAPGAVGRVVQSGKPLYLNDHVTTDAAGRLQVLLLDETVFTLGPNSDMVLDEFVYDPGNDSGKVTARVTKGVFRFVTGKVARRDPASMKVKLPVGTIGIRGTIAIGEAGPDSSTAILMGPGSQTNTDEAPGAITFDNEGQSRMMTQPGDGVTCKKGEPPSGVQDLSGKANEITAKLGPAADPKNQNAGGPKTDAGEQSGQKTAAAKNDTNTAIDDKESENLQSFLVQNAVQDSVKTFEGVSTWDQIRASLTMGTGTYFSGEAPINCSGACASSNPQGSLNLLIDFGARTIGGPGSFIHVHGINLSNNGDTGQQSISSLSFNSLTGGATIVLQNSPSAPNEAALGVYSNGLGGAGNFSGTTITLVNSNGVIASEAKVDMTFTGTNSLSSPVSIDGQFLAPR